MTPSLVTNATQGGGLYSLFSVAREPETPRARVKSGHFVLLQVQHTEGSKSNRTKRTRGVYQPLRARAAQTISARLCNTRDRKGQKDLLSAVLSAWFVLASVVVVVLLNLHLKP